LLDRLDDEQREAVVDSRRRSLVIAGPGSGKTHVITHKVAYLVASGVKPQEILLVTFTRRAAREMVARAQAVTKENLAAMLAGTFHHVCNVILRRYAKALGFTNAFSILDAEDALSLIRIAKREWTASHYVKGEKPHLPPPSALQDIFSLAVNACLSIAKATEELHPGFLLNRTDIQGIHRDYQRRKKAQNALDYDDLLLYCHALLTQHESIRRRVAGSFKWVLVDEFQDTSLIQAKLAELFASVHGNLFVVGDDAQSIYSFRGARYENVLDFAAADGPRGAGCRVFKIQSNYRSTRQVVSFINAKIPNNVFEKKLRAVRGDGPRPVIVHTLDRREEAVFVAQKIRELLEAGVEPSEIAVLYRAHAHSIDLQLELATRGIDFEIYSGVKFVEAAHVKDVLAFLRILCNSLDQIAWDRALNLFEGIGKVTADHLTREVLSEIEAGRDPFEFIQTKVLRRAAEGFAAFQSLLSTLRQCRKPSEILGIVYQEFYREYLETHYADYRDRQRDIERLIEIAARYSSSEGFLADLLLAERIEIEGEGDGGERRLVLTTVHQAKGLEWSVVFILALNPGDFPSSWAIAQGHLDEEERVFYVAITRAKDELYLCRQQTANFSYAYGDPFVLKSGTLDFLAEIPEDLVEEWVVE